MKKDIYTDKMRLAHACLNEASKNLRGFLSCLDILLTDIEHADKVSKSFLEHMQRQRCTAEEFLHKSSFEISYYVNQLYENYSELFANNICEKNE